jgi:hypothetical protein
LKRTFALNFARNSEFPQAITTGKWSRRANI